MRIMILGGNGYLGRHLSNYLMKMGEEVIRTVRDIKLMSGEQSKAIISSELSVIKKELRDNDYDVIINCVAVYEKKDTALHEIIEANLIFALSVLNYAVESGVKKFVTIDTSLPKELNLYSFTKKTFADYGRFYTQKYGINFINIELEMFYGEDEPENRFLVYCCRKMIRGEELLLTDGTQKRDIIYISDVCRAIKVLLEAPLEGFFIVPVGSGVAIRIREIIEYMHGYLKSESKLLFGAVPKRVGEPDCQADIHVLSSLGFECEYFWKKGIEHFCDGMKMR